MARARGSQANSLPPRAAPQAVLLTKHDFEQLKSHALLATQSSKVNAGGHGTASAPMAAVAPAAGQLAPPPRRTRSASLKSRHHHGPMAEVGCSSAPSTAPTRSANNSVGATVPHKHSRAQRPGAPSAHNRMERLSPQPDSKASAANRGGAHKVEPAAFRGVAGKLELQGYDPSRLLRQPAGQQVALLDVVSRPGGFSALPLSVAPSRGGPLGVNGASSPSPPPDPPRRPIYVGSNANVNLGMMVSGQAASIVSVPMTGGTDSPAPAFSEDLKDVDEWSSSEAENSGHEDSAAGDECNGKSFDYREYRYRQSQAARGRGGEGQLAARRRPPQPKRVASQFIMRGADEDDGCSSPWGLGLDGSRGGWLGAESGVDRVPSKAATPRKQSGRPSSPRKAAVPVATSRCSTPAPTCEEELQESEGLRRVADVLVAFYGLPGGVERAVRLRHGQAINAVVVEEDAWMRRSRADTQLDNPPVVWLRGGRVYDFHGDRGTLEEYQNDLLVRGVEDDDICRQRRKAQGLMPFPFVAAPLPQKPAEGEEPDPRGRRW